MTARQAQTLQQFEASFEDSSPPSGLSVPLEALWHAGHQSWDRAHRLVQDAPGAEAAWVHAHLHRVEGDLSNAAYWYHRAARPVAKADPAEERRAIASALLAEQDP